MTYKYFSDTSSGWTISTDPEAEPGKRWRAEHPEYGERFFAERVVGDRNVILEFTFNHMIEQWKKATDDR